MEGQHKEEAPCILNSRENWAVTCSIPVTGDKMEESGQVKGDRAIFPIAKRGAQITDSPIFTY